MTRWETRPLGAVCEVNPRDNGTQGMPDDTPVTFVPMAAVDEEAGEICGAESRTVASVRKGYTPFSEGDVLFAKITPCMENGKAAIARGLLDGVGYGSTEFHVLRPKPGIVAEWVLAFVRQKAFRELARSNFTGTAGQQRVPVDFLRQIEIPVPGLVEQKRLVALLAESNELMRLRRAATHRMSRAAASVFDSMFSNERAASRAWPTQPLGDLCAVSSGATPSRDNPDYWSGTIPWVSPKDMKDAELRDSIDHVTEAGVAAARLRVLDPGAVLVVVRGMILAHTFPVGISRVPLTINQDVRGLSAGDELIAEYLHWALNARASEVLSMVSTAGHGTKRLDMPSLLELTISVPPLIDQCMFRDRLREIRALSDAQVESHGRLVALSEAIANAAFQGDL